MDAIRIYVEEIWMDHFISALNSNTTENIKKKTRIVKSF